MKISAISISILLSLISAQVWAAPSDSAKSTENNVVDKNRTNLNFDDLLIQGKYHFSDEAIVTVEQDKALDALLGVRKDFKDRLKKSASRD